MNKLLITIGIGLICAFIIKHSWEIHVITKENKVRDSLYYDMYYAVIDTNEKDAYLVTLSTYNATSVQTDKTPTITSYNFKIDVKNPFSQRFIGLSKDLLENFRYGEIVILENAGDYNGYYLVADCMNNRFIRCIDVLIGKKQKHTKLHNVVLKHANKDD